MRQLQDAPLEGTGATVVLGHTDVLLVRQVEQAEVMGLARAREGDENQ